MKPEFDYYLFQNQIYLFYILNNQKIYKINKIIYIPNINTYVQIS